MLQPSSAFSFLRRFAIALVAVTVLTAVASISGKAYGKHEFANSPVVHIDTSILTPTKEGQPANYLLIGSDIRAADETPQEAQAYGTSSQVGPQHSDVMMVLHVDPASHTGMLVSFPRDLVVQIPGHGLNLLNASYAFGGASLVIQTIQQDFSPLKINHYLEVDFRGFKSIVNEIGHIHLWFPTPVHDPYTGLNVAQAGCVSVNGDQALAYARSRHYYVPQNTQNPAPWEWNYSPNLSANAYRGGSGWFATGSDIDRIPRQQYFLRTLSQAVINETGRDVFKINGLLTTIFKNLKHDQTLRYRELTDLALTFRGLNPAKVEMSTLPTIRSPYSQFPAQVVAKFPDAGFVVSRLAEFTAPKKTVVTPLESDKVKVRVVNGSGIKNAGTDALSTFTAAGFLSAGPAADADRSDYQTQVRYAPGKFREGFTVATAVGTLNLVEAASAKNTLGGDVLVIVGRDYSTITHHFESIPRPAVTIPSGEPTSTTVGSTTTTVAPTTTTSTTLRPTVDTRFVPVDPKTGGSLVGCPS